MKFNFRLYFILSFLAFVLCSCTNENPNAGKKVFRYNEAANINSLDPAYAKDQAMIWVDVQLYNGLVQMDNELNIRPSIAKSWEVSNDGLEYTFHLRNDVFFHPHSLFKNGKRRVVAADFVYSLNRIVDAKTMSPGAVFFENVEQINGKYSFFAPNDSTFIIRLKQAFSPFLGILTMPYASVVPKEIVEHYKEDFRKHPIGTGPFKFKMWKENVKLVLVKNEDYFETDSTGQRLPYLDAVAISFIVDKQSVFLEFVKGNIDFISGIDPNYKDEILTRSGKLQPKYKDKINLITQPYLNTEYLGFKMDDNDENNPLKDKRVRQAINYGFSREKMIKYMRNNIGYPGEFGIIPVGLAGFDSTVNSYEYNPEKSKRLLAEAGYPNGEGMQEITLSTTATYLDLCKYIQQQLGLLGIKVKIDVNPPAALREHIAQGKTQWFRGSWIADYPDAENYLSLFYSKNHCPKGSNYTHFSSKEYDRLYEQSILETDYEKRIALYKKMNDIIIEESPIVVLYYDQVLRFVQKNISGFESNPLNLLILKNVNKD
ncbi:MAG: ABC transporter substrate-binding protein [Bacteroidales bacterium]|nr:ABC transporter substrate-binding protein [Bacteroidales bacterium]